MADEPVVLVQDRDGVRTLSLNRPHRHNALDGGLMVALRCAVLTAVDDRAVRCIVLRGEGRSFCSGRDTAELGDHGDGEPVSEWLAGAQRTVLALHDTRKPVIAAMKGHCIGGGLELALAADIRIGAADLRASLPEVALGSLPDNGGTQVLTALIGPARTKELVWSGRPIEAGEALAWGLVNRVVAPDQLDSAVAELAGAVAARSPLAIHLTKRLVDNAWGEKVRAGIALELIASTAMFSSSDHAEAGAARRDGRPPVFTGH